MKGPFIILLLITSLASFSKVDIEESVSRISFSGTGISYSSISGTTFFVGAIYERSLNSNFLAGLGARGSFNSIKRTYGPQASLKYFFNGVKENSWYLVSSASYIWKTFKATNINDADFEATGGAGYQFLFGREDQWSLGLGMTLSTSKDSDPRGFIDLGFRI